MHFLLKTIKHTWTNGITSPLGQVYVVVDGWVSFVFVVEFTFGVFDGSGMETDTFVVIVPLIVGDAVILDAGYVVLLIGRGVVFDGRCVVLLIEGRYVVLLAGGCVVFMDGAGGYVVLPIGGYVVLLAGAGG